MPELETNRVDPSAASPGAILKRCREYHELTLEEVEESTKIGAVYLTALEEDQISQFASLAYLKGFLRIYATYLGLNPDDMIRLYEKLYIPGNGKASQDSNVSSTSSGQPGRKKFPIQKLAMPAAILILIILTATFINRSPAPPVRENPPVSATVPAASVPLQQARSSARRSAPVEAPKETVAEIKPGAPPPPARVIVQKPAADNGKSFVTRLKVTQSGTLTVTIDGSTSPAYDLAVGDSIEWKAERTISLELSNAGGVEAELNGRPLKPFGQPGKPATVVIDTDGVRQ